MNTNEFHDYDPQMKTEINGWLVSSLRYLASAPVRL